MPEAWSDLAAMPGEPLKIQNSRALAAGRITGKRQRRVIFRTNLIRHVANHIPVKIRAFIREMTMLTEVEKLTRNHDLGLRPIPAQKLEIRMCKSPNRGKCLLCHDPSRRKHHPLRTLTVNREFVPHTFSQKPKYAASGQLG